MRKIIRHSLQKINKIAPLYPDKVYIIDSFLEKNFFWGLSQELQNTCEWQEEFWIYDNKDWVETTTKNSFLKVPNSRRFSWNDTIKEENRSQLIELKRYQGLLSHPNFVITLSALMGLKLKWIPLDVAKYTKGHFLTRHADLFGKRRLGAVLFLTDSPHENAGANLIIENTFNNQCQLICPRQNRFVIFPIQEGFWHSVSPNSHESWSRISLATHFCLV